MECNNIYYAVDIDGEVFVKSDSEVSEIGHGCKIIGRVCTLECDTSCMAYLSASKDSSLPANGSGLLHHATIYQRAVTAFCT